MFAYRAAGSDGETGHAIVTERFVCLLGAESGAEVAVELYAMLADPATAIGDVLELFAAHGDARRVAIVEVLDAAASVLRVAVSGEVAIDMSDVGSTRLSNPSGAVWFDGELHGVRSLRLSIGAGADLDELDHRALPISGGVVATRHLSYVPAVIESVEIPVIEPVEIDGGSRQARPAEAAEPHAARIDLAALMNAPSWTLTLPDGSEVEISTPAIVGRRPWRSNPDETTTFYVVAPSPNREISSKHLEVAIVDDELQARDLDSTNGTLVLTPSRSPRLLHGGRSTKLHTGDILDLGESFLISVGSKPSR